MIFRVLGSCCRNRIRLDETARKVASEADLDAQLEYGDNPAAIVAYGALAAPELVIN